MRNCAISAFRITTFLYRHKSLNWIKASIRLNMIINWIFGAAVVILQITGLVTPHWNGNSKGRKKGIQKVEKLCLTCNNCMKRKHIT